MIVLFHHHPYHEEEKRAIQFIFIWNMNNRIIQIMFFFCLGPGVLDVPSPDVGLDVKFGFNDLCPVCGDKVSGFHYGLLTCESCKG